MDTHEQEHTEQEFIDSAVMAKVEALHGVDSFVSLGARCVLTRATHDAAKLDSLALQNRQNAGFLARFIWALRERDDAPHVLVQVGKVQRDERGMRKVYEAMRSGQDFGPPMAAYEFREMLRDGFTPEQATARHYPQIENYAKKGDASLSVAMGEAVRDYRRKPESFVRSTEGWLLRAWLPLTLWTCDAPQIERRMADAHALLLLENVNMPPVPTGSALDVLAKKVRHTISTGRK